MAKEWKSTATLLRGTLDRVERDIRSQEDGPSSSFSQGAALGSAPNHSNEANQAPSTASSLSLRAELDTIFGYRPDVSQQGSLALKKLEAKSNEGEITLPEAGSTW